MYVMYVDNVMYVAYNVMYCMLRSSDRLTYVVIFSKILDRLTYVVIYFILRSR